MCGDGGVEALLHQVPFNGLIIGMFGEVVMFPGICFQIEQFAQVFMMIGYQLPAVIAVHCGVGLVGIVDGSKKFRAHKITMLFGLAG